MNPLPLLDRPIAFHRCLVDVTGSITTALLLSQALYWQRCVPEQRQGWWFKSQAEWREETGLSRYEQESARKTLRGLALLQEERRGVPAKLWYRVNEAQLAERLASLAEPSSTPSASGGVSAAPQPAETPLSSVRENHSLECGNPSDQGAASPHSFKEQRLPTEITPETSITGHCTERSFQTVGECQPFCINAR